MKGKNHLPACQAYQDPKCCICALVRSHPEVEWKPIMKPVDWCGCVCHNDKWVNGLEHETECCPNMKGWYEARTRLGIINEGKNVGRKEVLDKAIEKITKLGKVYPDLVEMIDILEELKK